MTATQAQPKHKTNFNGSSVQIEGAGPEVGPYSSDRFQNPILKAGLKESSPQEQIDYLIEVIHVTNERNATKMAAIQNALDQEKKYNRQLIERAFELKQKIITLFDEA